MHRLVFVDDDKEDLRKFRKIVRGYYRCTTVHWPLQSKKLFSGPTPKILVSDLYLPSCNGDTTPTAAQREDAKRAAKRVSKQFSGLYSGPSVNHKARLRKTMDAIAEAYNLLKQQWSALGQSPGYGIALLMTWKAHHPKVPFVFYSRKITPEDVICVLQAGAVDAIRKGALENKEVLNRLALAQDIFQRKIVRRISARGLNANVTTIPRT